MSHKMQQKPAATTISFHLTDEAIMVRNYYNNNYYHNSNNNISMENNYNVTLAEEFNDVFHVIELIGYELNFYYLPLIVVTGTLGNTLSVIVFFKTKLRKLSSTNYLAALAVSDTCFLLGLFAQWLNFWDINIYNREHFCQFFTFISNLACFCSSWFVVAFTVERFIAVMYPLKRHSLCTGRRAKAVLLCLTILGALHCAPFWLFSRPVYSVKLQATLCDIRSEYKFYITLHNYWDTVIVYGIPFIIITILNTFTSCTVWKFATVRRHLTVQKTKPQQFTTDGMESCLSMSSVTMDNSITYRMATSTTPTTMKSQFSLNKLTNNQLKIIQRRAIVASASNMRKTAITEIDRKSGRRKLTNSSQLKVTKMLLIVSTVFVCLNLPSCVLRIKIFMATESPANDKTTVVLQYIFNLLFVTNFGINFVLYCVSGQNFRKAVLSMFKQMSGNPNENTTQATVSEFFRNGGGGGGGGVGYSGSIDGASCLTGGDNSSSNMNTSTRRRMMMTPTYWNEFHELHVLK